MEWGTLSTRMLARGCKEGSFVTVLSCKVMEVRWLLALYYFSACNSLPSQKVLYLYHLALVICICHPLWATLFHKYLLSAYCVSGTVLILEIPQWTNQSSVLLGLNSSVVGDKTIYVTGKLYNRLKDNSTSENGDEEQGRSGVDVRIGKHWLICSSAVKKM